MACSALIRTSWLVIDLPDPDAPGRPALAVVEAAVVVILVHLTPSPSKPALQEQVKPPSVLVQEPFFLLQLFFFGELHSLISLQTPFFLKKPSPQIRGGVVVVGAAVVVILVQVTPSPSKPALQEQVKLPSVLVQEPFFLLQLFFFGELHSLIS